MVVEVGAGTGNLLSHTLHDWSEALMMAGGQERNAAEDGRLLQKAGLKLTRLIPSDSLNWWGGGDVYAPEWTAGCGFLRLLNRYAPELHAAA
jgi:hypothetical protein